MTQTTETNKNKNMAFKMKGMSFKNSPVRQDNGDSTKVSKPKKSSEDEEQAYENAKNDYNTSNPTQAQLAQAMKDLKKSKDDIPR